jgi:Phosphoadenosine phosphosulfate reductase family
MFFVSVWNLVDSRNKPSPLHTLFFTRHRNGNLPKIMKQVEKKILDELAKHEMVTLGFSMGKDSVACMKLCQEAGVKKIYAMYFYDIPFLAFIEDQKKMYEDLFKQEIVMLPHRSIYHYMAGGDWQPIYMAAWFNSIDWPVLTYEDIVQSYLESVGIENPEAVPDVVGVRGAESFNRRKVFEKFGPIKMTNGTLKINMIYDWKKADVLEYLADRKIPLTDDYKIWNRSWDGLNYQWSIGMKKHRPKDWERMKEMFPLLESEIRRYEFNQKYYPKP